VALVLIDRAQETATANTTVSFTLLGASTGFQSLANVGNTNITYYGATDGTNWESGIGTYSTTGPTLTRTTILNSSNANAAVTFSGTVTVFVDYPSKRAVYFDSNNILTVNSLLSYSDTGVIASFASTVAGYNQVILQNLSNNSGASANFNISNDAGTATTNYGEFGINSSTFTGTGSFNTAGYVYLASASTDLAIGTYGANNIHFVTNSQTTDAVTINTSNAVAFNAQYGTAGQVLTSQGSASPPTWTAVGASSIPYGAIITTAAGWNLQ